MSVCLSVCRYVSLPACIVFLGHYSSFLCVHFKDCPFTKAASNTYLRVVYMGNIRIASCKACCMRWFFTFNDEECKAPAAVDAVVYQSIDANIHRSANIEGYCTGLAKGLVRVGLNVGRCKGFDTTYNAYTGWNSVSRIIIEEMEPPVV